MKLYLLGRDSTSLLLAIEMGFWINFCRLFAATVSVMLDVAQFWKERLFSWWRSRSPKDLLLHCQETAETFEEWEEAALQLDGLLSPDFWHENPTSKHYDYRLILSRLDAIVSARDHGDILPLVSLLRSGLVRNLGNITSPKLFTHAYVGTKYLIDDYISEVAKSIQYVTNLQTTPIHESGFTSQAKLELLHDTRQAFGRTTLVLQGGSIFGLCHLGVIKALHLRGLLPRIITGTATGALIAALVCIHTEDELLPFLIGEGIDLTAFDRRQSPDFLGKVDANLTDGRRDGIFRTIVRRLKRYVREGNFLDVSVLEECVRANVGDLTFEEAYARSKRILNITIATSGKGGFPNLLNYLTAPNVLIWSAAVASNATSRTLYSPVVLYCKDETGAVVPWPHTQDVAFRSYRQVDCTERESPLARLTELFNVNHFIVSQARPYIVPFLHSDLQRPYQRQSSQWSPTRPIMRLVILEIRHRLRQLDYIGLLPVSLRRLLIDESIPGPSLTLIPDLSPKDLLKLFQIPTKEGLKYWILRGERGVWPAVSELTVRCAIEIELDRGYQIVRRRKTNENPPVNTSTQQRRIANEGAPRKRRSIGAEQE
ncbi:Acyl transferase/acyl hydrolase/lysophospholipase [Elaphomyces granulatus]